MVEIKTRPGTSVRRAKARQPPVSKGKRLLRKEGIGAPRAGFEVHLGLPILRRIFRRWIRDLVRRRRSGRYPTGATTSGYGKYQC